MSGKIYLVPIGAVDEEVLSVVGEGLATALGREWGVADPLPHPAYAYHQRRQQYLSDAILNWLRQMALPAERLLGLVDLDLHTPRLNFVFGQASMGGRRLSSLCPACGRLSTACRTTKPSSTRGLSKKRYTSWATPTAWLTAPTRPVSCISLTLCRIRT